jgi:hypothetical protein
MNSFFTLHSFLEVGNKQDLSSKFWQTLGDALTVWQINLVKIETWQHSPFYAYICVRGSWLPSAVPYRWEGEKKEKDS